MNIDFMKPDDCIAYISMFLDDCVTNLPLKHVRLANEALARLRTYVAEQDAPLARQGAESGEGFEHA